MKLPLTVDGRDVVAEYASGEVTVGDIVGAVAGNPCSGAVATGDGRTVRAAEAAVDARLRPGLMVRSKGPPQPPAPRSSWALRVVAGLDAGRSIAVSLHPDDGPRVPRERLELRVGRDPSMDLVLRSPAVSKHHCTIAIDGPTISVADAGSTNGTVIGRHRIGSGWEPVEVGVPIRCGPAVFVVSAVSPSDPPPRVAELLATAPSGPVPFYRAPVDLAGDVGSGVPVPPPPRRPRTGRPGLLMLLIPLVMAAVMVKLTGQVMYAMFALMMPAMMMFQLVDRAGRNRRIRRKSRRRYRAELGEFGEDLGRVVQHELRRRRLMHPDTAELLHRATTASARLWHRRRDHPEFLTVALGVGDIPWELPLTEEHKDIDRFDDLAGMIEQASVLPLAPLSVGVMPGSIVGLAGDRASAVASLRSMLLQVAVHHGPAEVRVVLVASRDTAFDWEWLKWLPHIRPSSFAEGRLLAVVADADGRLDGAALDEVVADAEAGAALLVVVDTAGLADAGDLAVRRLLRRAGTPAGGIVLAPAVDDLPDVCNVVVMHDRTGEAVARWPREAGRGVEFVAAGVGSDLALDVARALARFSDPDAGGGSAALPARVGLADLLDLAEAAPADVLARWKQAGPLAVVAGLGESGPVAVGLEPAPHLVVVGGRGAGKTEHLLAMVVGIAAAHPPERVHVVLWGESFGHLHRLPHVASVVNRIDDNSASMVTEGIDRELSRRERLKTKGAAPTGEPRLVVVIDDVDTIFRLVPKAGDDIVRLMRRARGLGVHFLWSTGRASGGVINDLVDLASLRVVLRLPSGPESTDLLGNDAAAKLERSLPGRGYVVVGGAEAREVHGGVLTVGAPARLEELDVAAFSLATGRSRPGVRLGTPDERTLIPLICAAGATSLRPADLLSPAAAVNTALESPGLLELLGVDAPDGLDRIIDRWQTADSEAFLRVPIGVDPDLRPVLLDLKESALAGMGPHGLLVGATGSGKSELLRTLVCALAATHSPELLAFVLIDFKGGASFASFGRLPHVAGVVTNLADDIALIDRILAALGGEQRRRQELLAKAGNLANVGAYRAARAAGKLPPELADVPLPNLLIVVDEFAELLDQQPEFIDFFLTIGRVGRSLGIHLLLASQRLEEGKLRGLDTYLSYRLGLRTFSGAESRIVLGVPDAYSLPQAPGGGYLKVGSSSFERFQASYVSGRMDQLAGVDDVPAARSDPTVDTELVGVG